MVRRADIMNPNEAQYWTHIDRNMTCSSNIQTEVVPMDFTVVVNTSRYQTRDVDQITTNENNDYYEWTEREVSYLQYSYFIGYIGRI